MAFKLYVRSDSRGDSAHQQTFLEDAKLELLVAQEVQSYLIDTDGHQDPSVDPLEWWRCNSKRYPNVARAARKWLSVSSTSTPSERVFSICGVVDTPRRNRMVGESVENQVFLHNNYTQCENLK